MPRLAVPLHVADLGADGTLAAIPPAGPLLMEIGVSDRNTLAKELLPLLPTDSFLLSFEPLLEKFARGIAGRRERAVDLSEPLSHHHDRGIILPLAVGKVSAAAHESSRPFVGEEQTFRVGANAGCSSLMQLGGSRGAHARAANDGNITSSFGLACRRGAVGTRAVWVVPLSQALSWAGREVDLLRLSTV